MESSFRELIAILGDQKNILRQLTDTARDHSRALRQLDTKKLGPITAREEGLVAALRGYDLKREGAARNLAERLGISGDAALSRFIEKAPPSIKEELDVLLAEMSALARELAEINSLNRALIRQGMKINDLVIRTLSPARGQVYSPDGKLKGAQALSAVDKKI